MTPVMRITLRAKVPTETLVLLDYALHGQTSFFRPPLSRATVHFSATNLTRFR
jgi:hypothetical protein